MAKLTITEALAEIKTIDARLVKKADFIGQYLARQEKLKDPLVKDGGSREAIAREMQSMRDLQTRRVALRAAIRVANETTEITLGAFTLSIANWLVWRREVAPGMQRLYEQLSKGIQQVRQDALRRGVAVVTTADLSATPADILINVDEQQLANDQEELTTILGALDGQLSLKNATTFLELDGTA